ncbi:MULTISPECIES: phosphotransferase family protein [unclassified Curtobacterium]|uniref:phosphotransferase family protein n=1 Tax=unclassified Curtobacterium TaxID=257496 RepID=UPI001C646EAC|nr:MULTISPECIES: phosphotransferase [unclassified Curtobacterium]
MTPPPVTPEDLTAALRAGGSIGPDAVIDAVHARPIGIGALADTFLLTPTWRRGTGPTTLVAKLPSRDPQAAATAASIGAYAREVRFYEELAPRATVDTPAHLGTITVDGERVGLLLEDCSTLAPGDQLDDAPLAVLQRARQQLAALQAPFWDDPATASLDWLHRRQGVPIPGIHERMRRSWSTAADRIAGGFAPEERAAIDRFVGTADAWAASLDGPFTVSHHDFRMDNLLVGTDPERVVVLDWQTVGWGAPMFDVAYLLGTSLGPERRRRVERDEVARHVDELGAAGVSWSFPAAWEAYRRAAPAVLLMLVPPTGSVKTSPRTDAMYRRLLRQGARMVLDLDALELLPTGAV